MGSLGWVGLVGWGASEEEPSRFMVLVVEGWISASMSASRGVWSGSSCFTVVVVEGLAESEELFSGSELSEVGLGGSADMVAAAVSQRVKVTLR